MPWPLGYASGDGFADPNNPLGAGFWTVHFSGNDLPRIPEFVSNHIVITGPPGSSFQVYIGTVLWDAVTIGSQNSWDPSNPMPLQAGKNIYFYWNTGAGTAPHVNMFFTTVR